MIRMKPMSPAFTPNTFATGYWLQLTSVFNSTMSLFPKFLHLLFNFRRVWRLHRNLLCHLTQNSFVMCWMHLHLLLLNFQVSTNWQVGDNTTFDLIIRVLLGHSGSLLWAFPRVLTISSLEFDIASGSANSDSSFNDPPCVFKRDNRMFHVHQICHSQTRPMWLDASGFFYQTILSAPIFWRKYWIFWCSISLKVFPSSFCTSTKLDPLLLSWTLMLPVLTINCCRGCMKDSVSMLHALHKRTITAWKVSKYVVFLVRVFLYFLFPITGKYRPEKRPYLDTFHADFLFQNFLKRWYFQKNCTRIWSFLYYHEKLYLIFPKIWSYSWGRKWKKNGNTIFSVYTYKCHKYDIILLPQNSKTIFSQENTLKGDWNSRLTF